MASPQPPPPSRLRPITSAISASAKRSDILLLRLSHLLSTPSGIDTTLCTVSYSLTLLSSLLHRRLSMNLEKLAESVVSKAQDALLPGEAIIIEQKAPTHLKRLARAAESTKKFAGLVGDYRIFVRLWGLVGIYIWGRETYLNPPKDGLVKAITWAQVGVNALYQAMENVAYLAMHGVLNGDRWQGEEGAKRQTWWWVWSGRFWAAHVGLDFIKLGWQWYVEGQHGKDGAGAWVEGEKEEKVAVEERKRRKARWFREFVINAAYAPLVVHWSLEEGCVSEAMVGLLGTIAGGAGLKQMWKDTKKTG